jgi:Effector-associated domain 1
MDEQVNTRMAAVFWSITGVLAVGLCVVAGVLFGQTALWGATTAVTALYIGSIGIWFSRRDSPNNASGGRGRPQHSRQSMPSATTPSPEASNIGGIVVKIGSPEFSDLIHNLAARIDDPTDIIDIARRAGIRMSSLRSGGSQSPLSLWTAILTQAVRDGKVERLIAEAY